MTSDNQTSWFQSDILEYVIKIEEIIFNSGDKQGHLDLKSYKKTEYEEVPQVR